MTKKDKKEIEKLFYKIALYNFMLVLVQDFTYFCYVTDIIEVKND